MKANKAPEKLYIDFRDRAESTWRCAFTEKSLDTDIEYIRKDTFIAKVCEWLRTHSEVDYFELIPEANYCGAGNLNKKKMIEDFRKYMEEE